MSLTRDLVRLIDAKPVTDADLASAALFVLDTAACALGASTSDPARMLTAVAPPGTADTARRAFHFGGLAHILEMDDLHRESVTHPGSVVIPAAWAIAERDGLGGRAFLAAVLAGYEACCRVGMAVGRAHYRVWHNTSTCGPFGAAMAAGRLLCLDEDRMVWALGNAGTQSSGLWEFLATGAMSKHLHTARAAESGVLAALLAREGFTGPEAILEGEKGFFAGLCADPVPTAVTADPGRPWALTATSIKPWPCCRHTHPAIDAALALHDQLAGAAVASVAVATYQAALDVCDRPDPTEPYGARFSLQHCVAAALADGAVTPASFDGPARARLADTRAAVTVALSPEIDAAYPDAWGAELRLTTTDGRTLSAVRHDAKGDPGNPLSPAEIAAKARALMVDGGMAPAAADSLVAAILALPDDRPVAGLGLFAAAPTGAARSAA
ncbi:2-methylcitrate dehydratase PrpD [Amorphus suaedae]